MKKRKTTKQWQELFELRKSFEGTTAEFCRHYDVPHSSYYTHHKTFLNEEDLGNLRKKKSSTSERKSSFIHVIQPPKPQHSYPEMLSFNTKTGELRLPANFAAENIVSIIKGLIA